MSSSGVSFIETKLELSSLLRDLCDCGVLTEENVSSLSSSSSRVHPLIVIAEKQFDHGLKPNRKLDMEALLGWLGEQVEQPLYQIDPLKIDVGAIAEVMSFAFAQRHKILAVEVTDDAVVVASAEPYIRVWENNLEHVLRKPIRRVLVDPRDIERYTTEFYTMARSVEGARAKGQAQGVPPGNLEQMLELGKLKEPDANDQHIVNIVDWLLQYAFEQRASDIHIEPRREVGNVRFRIDGILYSVYELPAQVASAVTSRFKILGRMDVAERRRPQDGRLKTRTPDDVEVELRLSTLPTALGEKLVMRIFDPEVLLKGFEDLGLANEDLERWKNMTDQGNGIVLVTGPTGSGKTTTLYSTLKKLATSEVNVCTIEDPIEMVEPSFNQMQVQPSIDLDFADGVRALLRQDPDIIMVGEIRDLETAEMAVQAALTGHLVISTLHTNDSPRAITRLLELGVSPYLIKATLRGVMAQRLVRTLCPACKEEGELDVAVWKELVQPWKFPPPEKVYKPVGCLECRNTGYRGRQGLYEVMVMNEKIQELIGGESIDMDRLRNQAMKGGMRNLRLSGATIIASGETTIEEVLRVTPAVGN